MERTLGGERLGSGKKQKVHLEGFERSTHDLGYVFRTTMSAGTLVPFMCEVGLSGDRFDIDLDAFINTHPTIGPLFGSFKAQFDVFVAPIRLYNSKLHNNAIGIGMKMNTIKLPKIELTSEPITPLVGDVTPDLDNVQMNPSCILKYLGISGVGLPSPVGGNTGRRKFNGITLLMYWDIVKQFYTNKQESKGYVVHTEPEMIQTLVTSMTVNGGATIPPTLGIVAEPLSAASIILVTHTGQTDWSDVYLTTYNGRYPINVICDLVSNTGTLATFNYKYDEYGANSVFYWNYKNGMDAEFNSEIKIVPYDLTEIDNVKEQMLAQNGTVDFMVSDIMVEPFNLLFQENSGFKSRLYSQEGLAIKTYQSDIFNNWLNTDWIDGSGGVSELSAVDVSSGSLLIDALNLAQKVYKMFSRIAISGGTFKDWLEVVYDHPFVSLPEMPYYVGGLSKELVFQEVISQNSAAEGQDPLGTLGGRGLFNQKHKGGKINIKLDEPSYIIGIVSLTPRIDYSQGNAWHVHLDNMDDFHKPSLDQIGFQELPVEQFAWWSTQQIGGDWEQVSAGKQPAWINYMTNYNKTYGNFASKNQQMWMTLNRRYEVGQENDFYVVKDVTSYIDPAKFNHIFADTALDSQNFWMQIGVDITARRKMSSKVMPNI